MRWLAILMLLLVPTGSALAHTHSDVAQGGMTQGEVDDVPGVSPHAAHSGTADTADDHDGGGGEDDGHGGMMDDGQMMDGEDMGGMMDRMMGGGNVALWIVVVILAAALAGVIGYLIASRHPRG